MIDIIIEWWWLILLLGILIVLGIAMALRRVVAPNKIDIVVRKKKTDIYCANPEYFLKPKRDEETGLIIPHEQEELDAVEVKSVYYYFPSRLPFIGMHVRRLPLEMLEIKVPDFVAFDTKRAQFRCDIVAFCAIVDGRVAAMRIPAGYGNEKDTLTPLEKQVRQVLWATMRDSTTKMIVRDIINNRKDIIDRIRDPLKEALDNWGIGLKDIEIIEFKDGPEGKVITNISSIRHQEIETEARQKNANQKMQARLVEAESDEKAQIREVARDETVEKRKQDKIQKVAIQERLARQKELDVTQVDKVKNQQIDKEKAEVQAEQERAVAKIGAAKAKEVEAIMKEQKLLQGQGDRLRKEEQAIGEAAHFREDGLAEAEGLKAKLTAEGEGKGVLADNLKKFNPTSYEVYKILREIEKDEKIYTTLAESMATADAKLFMGGGKAGLDAFNFAKSMEGLLTGSTPTGLATLNRLGQPNDLGIIDKNWVKLAMVVEKSPELKETIRKALKEKKTKESKKTNKKEEREEIEKDVAEATKHLSDLFEEA